MTQNVVDLFTQLKERSGLSWDRIAAAMGVGKSTLQYYRRRDKWDGRLFDLDFVAALVPVLTNHGEPPIVEKDVWALADTKGGIILSRAPVAQIPIFGWDDLSGGLPILGRVKPSGILEAPGLKLGPYGAVLLLDDGLAQIERAGAYIIIDFNSIDLRDKRVYAIVIDGRAAVRRYFSNPARFESLAVPPAEAFYPSGPVEIIGRVIRADRVTHF